MPSHLHLCIWVVFLFLHATSHQKTIIAHKIVCMTAKATLDFDVNFHNDPDASNIMR